MFADGGSRTVNQSVCPWGHPYAGKNLGANRRNGAPFCKHCRKVSSRGTRRGGMTLAECYLIYPEWLGMAAGPLLRGRTS